jgi:hemolysin activation/secretion protein
MCARETNKIKTQHKYQVVKGTFNVNNKNYRKIPQKKTEKQKNITNTVSTYMSCSVVSGSVDLQLLLQQFHLLLPLQFQGCTKSPLSWCL